MNSPATSNPALVQLKDIHLPDAVSWWPLAPGYYLLLALCIGVSLWAWFALQKRHKQHAAKKAALVLLSQLTPDSIQIAVEVNSLLKRAAMSYVSREKIASLDGNAWYEWIDSALPADKQGKIGPLLDKRYQATGPNIAEATVLLAIAKCWLERALPLKEAKC